MRILYGVQATGNGHITRARVLLPALQAAGVEVDVLLSGRAPERLFNMAVSYTHLTLPTTPYV